MAGGSQGVGGSQASQLAQALQQYQGQSMNPGNYASPNQNFMQYPQQGQPNQPTALTQQPPPVQQQPSPDMNGSYAPTDTGFDGSGSDAGIGGQPVTQMQTPVQWQGNKPPSMSQFTQPQGLQIQGNPTSQTVQRPQQR